MPLVIPGLQSKDGKEDQTMKWTNSLVGKTLGDKSNETTFAMSDLPGKHRVVAPGEMAASDHHEDRLTIHTNKDGIVERVQFG